MAEHTQIIIHQLADWLMGKGITGADDLIGEPYDDSDHYVAFAEQIKEMFFNG